MAYYFEDDQPTGKFYFEDEQPTVKPSVKPRPTTMQRIARGAARVLPKPTLPVAGALLGGALAAPGNVMAPGLASFAGAGLGYGAGRRLQDVIQEVAGYKKPATLPQALASTAVDIPTGAAMEAGGALIGRGLSAGISKARGLFPSKTIDTTIEHGISKGIRPSVVGKGTFQGLRDYYGKAKQAVHAIIQNKENLNIVDEFGDKVNRLPKSLNEFSQAIKNTKETIFKQYDEMAKKAGQYGPTVNMAGIADELAPVVNSQALQDFFPNIAKYAEARAAQLTKANMYNTQNAQEVIKHFNNSLNAFYKNPTPGTAGNAAIDAMIANNIRKNLDDVIEMTKTFNPDLAKSKSYQTLKRTYGALKEIEGDVTKRAIVDARKNIKGLIDFSDMFSGHEVVHGLLSMNPATIASGGAVKGISAFYKHLNNPNTIIKKMFANVSKKMLPKTAPKGTPLISRVAGYKAAHIGEDDRKQASQKLAPILDKLDLSQTAEANQTSPAVRYVRAGQSAYLAGDFTAAIIAFKRAIKLDPSQAEQFRIAISMIKREQNALTERAKNKKKENRNNEKNLNGF